MRRIRLLSLEMHRELFGLPRDMLALATFLATPLAAGPLLAGPGGELDASFGENGRVSIQVPEDIGWDSVGWAIAIQPADGKVLVAGHALGDWPDYFGFVVLRLNTDGSLDETFGSKGFARIDFDDSDDLAMALAVLADGRILVAGHSQRFVDDRWENDFAVARLLPDGTLDESFDGDGRVTIDLGGGSEYISGIALLPNGQFVIAGSTGVNGDHDAVFMRFNADGTLDATFGTGAIAGAALVGSQIIDEYPLGMTQQSDGKLVACGFSRSTASEPSAVSLLAIRVNPDGSTDIGFGENGIVQIATGASIAAAQACLAMPDGTTMLAGFSGEADQEDLLLARLADDGRLDASFGTSGIARIDLGGAETLQGMIRLADGHLGVIGLTAALRESAYPSEWPTFPIMMPSRAPSEMLLAKLDSETGGLDPSFGNAGVTVVDFGLHDERSYAYGRSLAQQADGKIVAVGTTISALNSDLSRESPSIAVARLDPAGAGNVGFAGFTETFASVGETDGEVEALIRRTGGSTGHLSVDFETVSLTAEAPQDFMAIGGTLTWLSGDMEAKRITVPIVNDDFDEDSESFTVVLSSSTSPLAASELRVQIDDDDYRRSTISVSGGGAIGVELILLALAAVIATRGRRSSIGDIPRLCNDPVSSNSAAA